MRFILFSIFILGTIKLFGQVDGKDLILTQEQNENWFIRLGQIEFKDQVDLIDRRLLLDTNVFIPNRYTRENFNGRRLAGFCKPIIVAGGIPILIENTTNTDGIERLTKLLNVKTIKSIQIIDGEKATAIYGSRGECKVLIVTIEKKSTKRKLKKLNEKMNPNTVIKEIRWRH